MKRSLLAIACLTLLTGCPPVTPVTLKTVTLSPSAIYWEPDNYINLSWECSYSTQWNGLGPSYSAGSNDTLSGYESLYLQGSGPAPCTQQSWTNYRGTIVFDLSQFDAAIASLTFNVESSLAVSPTGGGTQTPPNCNATTLGMATGTDHYNFDNPVSLPTGCSVLIPPTYSLNVNTQVQSWLNGSHGNYGFILAGPNLDLQDESDHNYNGDTASVSWYNDFQLVVTYNPALNPRAPQ
jgi:hypothetical protein